MGDWRHRAACLDQDPELWFPVSSGGRGMEPSATDRAEAAPALAVCWRCPVIGECRDWAIAAGERHGIWGGMLPYDRAVHAHENLPTRPVAAATDSKQVLVGMVAAGFRVADIAEQFGVTRKTVRAWLARERVS